MVATPVLTPQPTSGRVPRIDVQFPSFDTGVAAFTLYRTSADGRTSAVRGGVRVAAVAGVTIPDEEAGPGSNSYRAEQFDASGMSLGYTDSASTVLTFTGTVLHQPLDPSLHVDVSDLIVLADSASTRVRPVQSSTLFPEDGPVGIGVAGRRRSLSGLVLKFATCTFAAADALQAIFGTYDTPQLPVVCIRTTLRMRLPSVLFLNVTDLQELDGDNTTGGELLLWQMTGDEVSSPAPGLVVPILTYDDLDAAYATYDVRDAAYSSYTQMDSDYSLAGLAGGS